jgi:tRNA dimethylallyltransferase
MLRKLIIIAGPTAIGKTDISIQIAQSMGGEIISADSRQLYRYMEIATAKPSAAQLAQVRHHGFDLKDPDERYSAGEYAAYARRIAEEIWRRGLIPVVVGGSGLYLQAFLDGLWPEKEHPDQVRSALQQRLRAEGLGRLYELLERLDPIAHARTRARDTQRILRALEMALAAGGDRGRGTDPLGCTPLAFCLYRCREEIYRRIGQRVEAMVGQGLLGEVQALLARGYGRGACAMQSLGYSELLDHLEGRCNLPTALDQMKRRTRHFAKRQLTWFRRDRRYRWIDLDRHGDSGAVDRVLAQMRNRWRF